MRRVESIAALIALVGFSLASNTVERWRGVLAIVALAGACASVIGLLHAWGMTPALLRGIGWQRVLDRFISRIPSAHDRRRDAPPRPDTSTRVRLLDLLPQRVIGQPGVCRDLADQLRIRLAKTQRRQPVAVFAIVAPPHSGKRWLAHCVDRALHDASATCEIDLRHCALPIAAALFGEPRSLANPGRRGELTSALRERAARVVVLRGLDAADAATASQLLRAWNRGELIDGHVGETLSTRDVIFFVLIDELPLALAREIQSSRDDRNLVSALCHKALRGTLPPSLLDRIDRFFPLEPLDMDDLSRIAAARLQQSIGEFGIEIEAVDASLVRDCLDAARPAPRTPHAAAEFLQRQLDLQLSTLQSDGIRRVRLRNDAGALRLIPA
jgi:ATP-dependent Clp protease ATP-binding subunit ClpA